jgi:hypothetical protein
VVEGETLAERLEAIGKKASVDAVRFSLRIADALTHVHEAGGVHGALTPQAVVADPVGGASPCIAWTLGTDAPAPHPRARARRAPVHRRRHLGDGGLLHWMLTGTRPPDAGYASEDEIEQAGVADAALRTALFHTLTQSRPDRQSDLRPLRRELARWFVEHAAEEPILPATTSALRHPCPRAFARRTDRRRENRCRPIGKRRLGAFATGAIALGVVGGIALTFLRPKQIRLIARPETSKDRRPRPRSSSAKCR